MKELFTWNYAGQVSEKKEKKKRKETEFLKEVWSFIIGSPVLCSVGEGF